MIWLRGMSRPRWRYSPRSSSRFKLYDSPSRLFYADLTAESFKLVSKIFWILWYPLLLAEFLQLCRRPFASRYNCIPLFPGIHRPAVRGYIAISRKFPLHRGPPWVWPQFSALSKTSAHSFPSEELRHMHSFYSPLFSSLDFVVPEIDLSPLSKIYALLIILVYTETLNFPKLSLTCLHFKCASHALLSRHRGT